MPFSLIRRQSFIMMSTLTLLWGVFVCATNAQDADTILAGADQRIEEHRMADATITVIDTQGKLLSGVTVEIEQTRHEFLFGSNIFKLGKMATADQEAAYEKLYAELLNFATLPFYWWSYEQEQGQPEHESRREVAQWCKEHDITTKGHPLAWNYRESGWLPKDAKTIEQLQLARIDDCVTEFKGLIDRWDVVNEITHYNRPEILKVAPKMAAMIEEIGPVEFTRRCFVEARKANPDATLLINDYRVDEAYAKIIEQLVDENGKPLYDVIGIQSHQHGGAWSIETTWEVCERFARFDVPLHFTETTFLSGEQGWERKKNAPNFNWKSTEEGERRQAKEVTQFYTILFSHPSVEAITWWDFSDQGAWQGAPAGLIRADGTPKPAYEELKKLIKQKWWTRESVTTGADGNASFRGFLGDYLIRVTRPDATVQSQNVTISKDVSNQIAIELN